MAILFVCDYTRVRVVNFMKHEHQATENLEKFKQVVTDANLPFYVKTIRSHQGGEFTSRVFRNFCTTNNDRHEFTAR